MLKKLFSININTMLSMEGSMHIPCNELLKALLNTPNRNILIVVSKDPLCRSYQKSKEN